MERKSSGERRSQDLNSVKEKVEELNKAGTNNAAFKGQKQARS